jgi:predicted Zn-dependent peptidase
MCQGEPYARYEYGALDEIDVLTPKALAEVWRDTLQTAPIDVFVVGSAEPEQVRDLVGEAFCDLRSGSEVRAPPPVVRRRPGRLRRVREKDDVMQARLVMGFRTEVAYGDPLSIPLVVWNMVFGGGPSSRLFRVVREKHSLAYYCSSSVDQSKGVAFVQAGIDERQADRVERIVRRQMGDLARNGPSLEELRAAKASLKAGVLSITDSAPRIAGFFLERRNTGTMMEIGELLDRIARIRREDVARAGATVQPDTYYLLARGAG